MANFSYIIGDKMSGIAAVIDPHDDFEAIEEAVGKAKLKVASILLTHGHYDHVGGLKYYADKLGLPVYLSAQEHFLFVPRFSNLIRFNDNEKIMVGSLPVLCLATPGHTPGCTCFLVNGNLITGDTLFVEAVGRTDLPGGDATALFNSLQRIKGLSGNPEIWPGHNYGFATSARLDVLKSKNPYLACHNFKEFLQLLA